MEEVEENMSTKRTGIAEVLSAFWRRVKTFLYSTFATIDTVDDIVDGKTVVGKASSSDRTSDICIGYCMTGGDEQTKIVSCENFTLSKGRHILVTFIYGNNAQNMKLNVGGTGEVSVIVKNSANKPMGPGAITAYANVEFVYNGAVWVADTDIVERVNTEEYGYTIYANGNITQYVNKNFPNVAFNTLTGSFYTSDNTFDVQFPITFPTKCTTVSIASESMVDFGLIVGGVNYNQSEMKTKLFRLTEYTHDVALYIVAEGY